MTGDPGKEHRTNKPPPTTRVQERSKGDTMRPITSQKPSHWHLSWLSNVCTTRKDSAQNGWPKTTRKLIPSRSNPRLRARAGRAALLGSLTLLLSSWQPLPDKISCFVCTCVTSDSFPSVKQECTFGPGRGPPFCNSWVRKDSDKSEYTHVPMFKLDQQSTITQVQKYIK